MYTTQKKKKRKRKEEKKKKKREKGYINYTTAVSVVYLMVINHIV